MKHNYQIVLGVSLLMLSLPIYCEPLSWSFITVDYTLSTVDLNNVVEDLEGDSISFSGFFNVADQVALTGGYSTGSSDVSGNGNTLELDTDGYYLGALYHTPLTGSSDFFIGVRYIDITQDTFLNGIFLGKDDGDGNSIFVGVRGKASAKLELTGFIDRSNIEDETDTYINFEAAYFIAPSFSVDAGYSFDSDANTLSFGVTKYF